MILTILCVAVYAFIFYNSSLGEVESASQSSTVTDAVQDVAGVIAPQSPVATATGESYERLHDFVRLCAHFAEFSLLGALLIWCCFSYTDEALFLCIPVLLIAFTPVVDECIQLFSSGRVADLHDIFIDTLGGYLGAAFAIFTVLLGKGIKHARKRMINGVDKV